MNASRPGAGLPGRPPAVAGTFYPANAARLRALVDELLREADEVAGGAHLVRFAGGPSSGRPASGRPASGGLSSDRPTTAGPPSGPPFAGDGRPLGLLVPHAGLVYSGLVAATAWRRLACSTPEAGIADGSAAMAVAAEGPIVVILGTNHGAGWLDGVGVWDAGPWRIPLGDVPTDDDLALEIADLGEPFVVDRLAHLSEHSIEVQLPILVATSGQARIVPLAVSAGTDAAAIEAGERLGRLLADRRRGGAPVVLAISSDMAHYPPAGPCAAATADLLPAILDLAPDVLATRERALTRSRTSGLVCGMCGIQPAVLGLAALRAMGATRGIATAAATSADAGGPDDRTVGYLGVEFVSG